MMPSRPKQQEEGRFERGRAVMGQTLVELDCVPGAGKNLARRSLRRPISDSANHSPAFDQVESGQCHVMIPPTAPHRVERERPSSDQNDCAMILLAASTIAGESASLLGAPRKPSCLISWFQSGPAGTLVGRERCFRHGRAFYLTAVTRNLKMSTRNETCWCRLSLLWQISAIDRRNWIPESSGFSLSHARDAREGLASPGRQGGASTN